MELNHLNLAVTDVTGAAAFLRTYFASQSLVDRNAALPSRCWLELAGDTLGEIDNPSPL